MHRLLNTNLQMSNKLISYKLQGSPKNVSLSKSNNTIIADPCHRTQDFSLQSYFKCIKHASYNHLLTRIGCTNEGNCINRIRKIPVGLQDTLYRASPIISTVTDRKYRENLDQYKILFCFFLFLLFWQSSFPIWEK